MCYARDRILILYGCTHPDIRRPLELLRVSFSNIGAFRQYLECVLRAFIHDGEQVLEETHGDLFMEGVTHRIDKD